MHTPVQDAKIALKLEAACCRWHCRPGRRERFYQSGCRSYKWCNIRNIRGVLLCNGGCGGGLELQALSFIILLLLAPLEGPITCCYVASRSG